MVVFVERILGILLNLFRISDISERRSVVNEPLPGNNRHRGCMRHFLNFRDFRKGHILFRATAQSIGSANGNK